MDLLSRKKSNYFKTHLLGDLRFPTLFIFIGILLDMMENETWVYKVKVSWYRWRLQFLHLE